MASRQMSGSGRGTTRKTETTNKKKEQTRPGRQADKMPRVAEEALVGQTKESAVLTREQIEERAKVIWQRRGCPSDQDEKNWLEAETQLKTELGAR